MRRGLLAFLLAVAVTITGLAVSPSSASAGTVVIGNTITGQVQHAFTSAPLDGVEVKVYNPAGLVPVASTITDVSGNYAINGIADGDYYVRFRKVSGGFARQWFPGTARPSVLVNVNSGSVTYADGDLVPTFALTGHVVAPDGTTPVAGARVYARQGSEFSRKVISSADGSFAMPDLPASEYQIYVIPNGGPYRHTWYNQTNKLDASYITLFGAPQDITVQLLAAPIPI